MEKLCRNYPPNYVGISTCRILLYIRRLSDEATNQPPEEATVCEDDPHESDLVLLRVQRLLLPLLLKKKILKTISGLLTSTRLQLELLSILL
jgi:hypothetical protein